MALRRRTALLLALTFAGISRAQPDPADERAAWEFARELKGRRQFLLSATYAGWLSRTAADPALRADALLQFSILMDRLDQKDEAHAALLRGLGDPANPRHADFSLLAATRGLERPENLDADTRRRFDAWTGRYRDAGSFAAHADLIAAQRALRREEGRHVGVGMAMSGIVPGSGQAYLGDFQAASLSFLVNALFGLATYQLFKENLPYVGAASGLVLSITYVGNVFNVHKISARRRANLRERIDEAALDRILFPAPADAASLSP